MRRAIWMALAFMGTAPLVALAQQQNTGSAPAASPSGAASIDRGQDTTATQPPGAPGQQSAGSIGTQGQPATGGMQGTPGQTGGVGGAGGAMGTGGSAGPTYRGTEQTPSASPPVDVGTRVGPEPGEQAGGAGTGTVGTGTGTGGTGTGTVGSGGTGTGGTGTGTGTVGSGGTGTGGTGVSGGGTGTGRGGEIGGQSAMQRELTLLRQRVASLEAEVDALRGTGGGGTAGGATPGVDTGTPGPDPEDMKIQGPVAVATAVFDGRVVDVARKHIDIVDTSDGSFYRLTVDDQTKAFVGPDLKRIPVNQISEGTPVRTSFALISGVEHARNIVTHPERALQRQEQQQRQQRQQQRAPGQRMEAPPRQTPEQ